jgi:hypothetical protein
MNYMLDCMTIFKLAISGEQNALAVHVCLLSLREPFGGSLLLQDYN